MAYVPIGPDAAPVIPHAAEALAMPAVAQILGRYDRQKLETFLTVAIDLLDVMDGDPDANDTNDAEDDFVLSARALADSDNGPGCVISDAGEPAGDERDHSWPEWHTRGRCKLTAGGYETRCAAGSSEDDEDDDPDTGVEDDPDGFDPEEDQCPAGDDGCGPFVGGSSHKVGGVQWGSDHEGGEHLLIPQYGIDQTKGPIATTIIGEDRELKRPHIERIRATRCYLLRTAHRGLPLGYRLRDEPMAPTRRQLLNRKRGVPRRPRA